MWRSSDSGQGWKLVDEYTTDVIGEAETLTFIPDGGVPVGGTTQSEQDYHPVLRYSQDGQNGWSNLYDQFGYSGLYRQVSGLAVSGSAVYATIDISDYDHKRSQVAVFRAPLDHLSQWTEFAKTPVTVPWVGFTPTWGRLIALQDGSLLTTRGTGDEGLTKGRFETWLIRPSGQVSLTDALTTAFNDDTWFWGSMGREVAVSAKGNIFVVGTYTTAEKALNSIVRKTGVPLLGI